MVMKTQEAETGKPLTGLQFFALLDGSTQASSAGTRHFARKLSLSLSSKQVNS